MDDVQEVVRCKRFELVDDEGRTRVSISVRDRDVNFTMFDENGGVKAEIEYDGKDDDIGLFLFHQGGSRVSLGVSKEGKAYLFGDFRQEG